MLQTDGNFVLYNGAAPLWHTDTWGNDGAELVLQDDCNLVIYANGEALWSTGTFGQC